MRWLTRFFLTPRGMALDRWFVRMFSRSALNSLMARHHGFTAPPVFILCTIGHTTGRLRDVVLPYLIWRGEKIVVGSKGGAPDDPVWVTNLRHTPDAEIFHGHRRHPVKARILDGDERAACWDFVTGAMPVYGRYQKRTTRQIPLVALETR